MKVHIEDHEAQFHRNFPAAHVRDNLNYITAPDDFLPPYVANPNHQTVDLEAARPVRPQQTVVENEPELNDISRGVVVVIICFPPIAMALVAMTLYLTSTRPPSGLIGTLMILFSLFYLVTAVAPCRRRRLLAAMALTGHLATFVSLLFMLWMNHHFPG